MNVSTIDIYCHVIDNYGDAGVAIRFAKELQISRPGCRIRLFIDEPQILKAILPSIDIDRLPATCNGFTIHHAASISVQTAAQIGAAEVLIEAFACRIPDPIMEIAYTQSALLINLDHLSAEPWVEGYHLKQSLLPKGTLKKFFYMPGFTTKTGGILVDSQVEQQRPHSPAQCRDFIARLLLRYGIRAQIDSCSAIGTIFTYLHAFAPLLRELRTLPNPVCLLVFGQKAHQSFFTALGRDSIRSSTAPQPIFQIENVRIIFMPMIAQPEYDLLLCCADFNFVRGEDSWARALLAQRPFIWNAYIQQDSYQLVKVEAFLEQMRSCFDAPELFLYYKKLMLAFNDIQNESATAETFEEYGVFFANLQAIGHATEKMSYFVKNNCNLMEGINTFINEFAPDRGEVSP